MIQYGHYVGGKHVAGKSGRTAQVFQPMDGTVRAHVALASKAEMRAAVENAKAAQANLVDLAYVTAMILLALVLVLFVAARIFGRPRTKAGFLRRHLRSRASRTARPPQPTGPTIPADPPPTAVVPMSRKRSD